MRQAEQEVDVTLLSCSYQLIVFLHRTHGLEQVKVTAFDGLLHGPTCIER